MAIISKPKKKSDSSNRGQEIRHEKSQTSLIENEVGYRALFDATSDAIYRMSPDWNEMLQLDGKGFLTDTGERINDWVQKYIPPPDQEYIRMTVKEAIRAKRLFQLEHRVIQTDGTLGWAYSQAVPILDQEGNIIEWFGAANNVTHRKKNEQDLEDAKDALEQQKRLYETITSNTPDLIYVFDLTYRFTYANDALLTMWGKTWDEAIGKNLLENGYEPWHAERHEREIDTVVATKRAIRGEVSFPHATLGRRVYDYIFSPVINHLGEVEAIAGTTRDITDIKQSEIVLAESEARFRTMAEGSNIFIAVTNAIGDVEYVNQAWLTLTGKSTHDLLANRWPEIIHKQDLDRFNAIYLEALRTQTPFHCDFRVISKQGQYRWLLADGSVRRGPDGAFAGFISSAIDITELKEDEQRKNDFISMVSHELKTPLTSSLAYVQVSKKRALENNDTISSGMLERTEKQLSKTGRLINGFLNVSRLQSGKIQIDRERFDISSLLKEVKEDVLSLITSHQIILGTCTELWVVGDREKIGQVIQNLISNAVKYSDVDSTIKVSCRAESGEALIAVADEGIGISENDISRLFERFYRVRDVEKGNISGFGIGLYLSAEIIKQHGGRIWAESTLGKGSTFYFTMPTGQ